jgi:hypothetical protein
MDILRQEKTFPCRHWFKTGFFGFFIRFCGERASRLLGELMAWMLKYGLDCESLCPTARGFRDFKNYRTRILVFCGKLSLAP